MVATASLNPATGELIGNLPVQTVEDLRAAIAAARDAQRAWADTKPRARAKQLRRVRNYIVEHAEELAQIISHDNGKTRTDAMVAEVVPGALAVDYWCKMAPRFLKPRPVSSSLFFAFKRSVMHRVPFGVIGVMSPWNYPFSIPFYEVLMGLLAGNAVILKVASDTVQVGVAIENCIAAAGLPEGLFQHVNMPGRVAGDAFLEAGIDKLFFTGSVPVGKKLMAKAAETLTPVSLELGGNDAMIVCRDADLDRAANGATWAGFQNCGQSCGGVERIYVEREVYEPFLEKLAKRVRGLRVGPDKDFEVDLGAITTARQLETVRKHIASAVESGATIYATSQAPGGDEGIFHPAVVLTDVDHTMTVMRDETFGPVVGVMPVDSVEEAIELANDSNLGLSGSVWTRNSRRGVEIAQRVRAGAVLINDHLMSHGMPEIPWGGFGESGLGRAHGEAGFDEMTEPQVIVRDILPLKKLPWWHPHGRHSYEGVYGAAQALFGPGLKKRMQGSGRFLKLLRKGGLR